MIFNVVMNLDPYCFFRIGYGHITIFSCVTAGKCFDIIQSRFFNEVSFKVINLIAVRISSFLTTIMTNNLILI